MRAVIQRTNYGSVTINGQVKGKIDQGLVVLIGIENDDDDNDIQWLSKKIVNLRIFADEEGLMNKSLLDIDGQLLIVSQFTLHANTKKGNRPSFIKTIQTVLPVIII